MKIENTIEVDAPLDRVWALVNDIPRVAPCMPGAALTGVLDDQTYEGTVAVKLGPLRMSYKGKVTVEDVDEANHSARLAASGRDTKGAGTAKASVVTRLEAAGDTRTHLHVTSDVQLTGKVASFGRGGAINDVATRLFGQFADCLRATLEAESATPEPATPTPGPEAPAPAASTVSTPVGSEAAATAASTGSTPAGSEAAATAAPTGSTSAAPASPTGSGSAPAPSAPAPAEAPSAPAPAEAGVPSRPAAAGDGTTTAGDRAPTPPPRAAEALDAGSLVGTVIKGRLQALFQAIAGFFRRLFGGRRSQT
ncbi:MAG TPA: SRPBCC family protein [Actinomycetota bacterium]|nr:SRPBCC family protein [Actinomycetota bacterium]